eukprot:Clim_evm39s214 gene=Clim_evmTU39s214
MTSTQRKHPLPPEIRGKAPPPIPPRPPSTRTIFAATHSVPANGHAAHAAGGTTAPPPLARADSDEFCDDDFDSALGQASAPEPGTANGPNNNMILRRLRSTSTTSWGEDYDKFDEVDTHGKSSNAVITTADELVHRTSKLSVGDIRAWQETEDYDYAMRLQRAQEAEIGERERRTHVDEIIARGLQQSDQVRSLLQAEDRTWKQKISQRYSARQPGVRGTSHDVSAAGASSAAASGSGEYSFAQMRDKRWHVLYAQENSPERRPVNSTTNAGVIAPLPLDANKSMTPRAPTTEHASGRSTASGSGSTNYRRASSKTSAAVRRHRSEIARTRHIDPVNGEIVNYKKATATDIYGMGDDGFETLDQLLGSNSTALNGGVPAVFTGPKGTMPQTQHPQQRNRAATAPVKSADELFGSVEPQTPDDPYAVFDELRKGDGKVRVNEFDCAKLGADMDLALPGKLTKNQVLKRFLITQELRETEDRFVTDMKIVYEVYYPPLKKEKKALKKDERKVLFPTSLALLLDIHLNILQQLKRKIESYSEDTMLGDILLVQVEEYGSVYQQYTRDYQTAMNLLGKLAKDNSKFRDIMQKCDSDPRAENLNMAAYMLSPIQRLPRYILLLKEMLKVTPSDHHDYLYLMKSRDSLTKVMETINSHQSK